MKNLIISYKSVREFSVSGLDKAVNELIGQGYQPFGGPLSIITNGVNGVQQALVKYDDRSEYARTAPAPKAA